MEYTEAAYCCGLAEIGAFDNTTWDVAQDPNLTNLRAQVRDARMGCGSGFIVATTIPEQKKAISLLRKGKFKVLAKFTNPNTRNKVTLWGKRTGRG